MSGLRRRAGSANGRYAVDRECILYASLLAGLEPDVDAAERLRRADLGAT